MTKIGIYTLREILENYKDNKIYKNADEAYKDFIKDYEEEISKIKTEFGENNIKGEASCVLNDYYEKTKKN